MCADGDSLDSELREGNGGEATSVVLCIQAVKGDEGASHQILRSVPNCPRLLQLLQIRFGYEGIRRPFGVVAHLSTEGK
jgi:hypothetical protein